jgi:hypothetical protein
MVLAGVAVTPIAERMPQRLVARRREAIGMSNLLTPVTGHHEFGNAESYFLVGDALGKGVMAQGKQGRRVAAAGGKLRPRQLTRSRNVA